MMVKIILVRHGYSLTNKSRRFTGHMDVDLDEIGYKQAELVSDYIFNNYKVDRIYSSDLKRAVNTVKPLADRLGMTVETTKSLRELDVGKWENVAIDEIAKLYPYTYANYVSKPWEVKCDGGESYGDLLDRSLEGIRKIVCENDGKTVVVATHGGVVRALRSAWTGIGIENIISIPHVNNASITEVEVDAESGMATLGVIGYDKFLGDEMVSVALEYDKK